MIMELNKIPKNYRPVPFWSWNDKLNVKETSDQVRMMDRVGIGGFFMHARGGLSTEYMGEEWFENISSAVQTSAECGMGAWVYDENGWPSGFGNGFVNGLGVRYQQKYLRMTDHEPEANVIGKSGSHWFYYDVNPFYVDTLDRDVVAKFVEKIYTPYYEKYGNAIEGFFTDEPQISRNGIPWSFVFEREYQDRYQEIITEHLEELYLPIADYKDTRVKFWKMVTDLFSTAYMKQIYDWCDERGLKLTGHLVLEDTLESQLITNGACMPHYEYMHVPGMDWLGRDVYECLTPMQVSSVCEQLGKNQVLSETFALCGHNVSFSELKGIYEWQMVHGINLLCQHLEGYSIRGIRKRDYPPAMYFQQPWWREYDKFNAALAREGMILSVGEKKVDVLIIHPQTTAWTCYDNGDNKGLAELNNNLLKIVRSLEEKHILYHLGDETIMERHAYVNGGKLVIGKQSYSCILCEHCEVLFENTRKLLDKFVKSGGKVVTVDDLIADAIVDNTRITYTRRSFEDYRIHYFVNSSPNYEKAEFQVNGKILDIFTGELKAFSGNHEFEPWGSLMIVEDGTENEHSEEVPPTYIQLEGSFKISEPVQNLLTLDRCDYYFDGELQEKDGYVLNICERANALERAVKIHQDYHVTVDYIPEKLYLLCETPDMFTITVNGKIMDKTAKGYFADKSIQKIDISNTIVKGENSISFDCEFEQSETFYQNRRNGFLFESEKNKLVYDMEIEAIYLLGDFSVSTDGKWDRLEKNAVRYSGDFKISAPKKEIRIQNIEQQGYPFFCGEMKLEGEIEIIGENPVLEIDRKGINVVKVEIGDITRTMLTDNKLPLSGLGVKGKTTIKLTVINNLRNLLGPHHLEEGESYSVCPSAFFKEPCLWNANEAEPWNDGYCFVETGL